MKRVKLSKLKQLKLLAAELLEERKSHDVVWKDIADHILPYSPAFLDYKDDKNKGKRKDQLIMNNVATMAANTLQAGMMSGVTSPSRPWFKLGSPFSINQKISQEGEEWLDECTKRMYSVYAGSNLYQVLPSIYKVAGTFGIGAMVIEEDIENVIHCSELPIGSYAIAANKKGFIDVLYREINYTIRQLFDRFGKFDENDNLVNPEAFSDRARSSYKAGRLDAQITVCHHIMPNVDHDPDKLDPKYKRYSSIYYEKGATDNQGFLLESGMNRFRVLCNRWEVSGEGVYPVSCPGRVCIGDVKSLQHRQKKVWNALDQEINPAMMASTDVTTIDARPLSGGADGVQGITYVSPETMAQGGVRPLYNVQLNIPPILDDIQRHEDRINKAYFVDLFLMMANSDRRQITAREIEERHEEKLLALGPVFEQLDFDVLTPLIEITFEIMLEQGLISPPPEEFQGHKLKIEYVSVMAQAQKIASLSGIDRVSRYTGEVSSFAPDVLDKIDTDKLIEEYADVVGVTPKIMRSKDDVEAIRSAREQAQQQQAMADSMSQQAQTAKALSETDMDRNSGLNQLLQQANAGQVV